MLIGIVGAGNGGLALAGLLYKRGHTVNIWNRSSARIKPIIENGNSFVLSDGDDSIISINMISTDLKKVFNLVEIVFIVTPSTAHEELGGILPEFISDSVPIVLLPGRTYGCPAFLKAASNRFPNKLPLCLEAQTLLHACRVVGTRVEVYGTKKEVKYSSIGPIAIEVTRLITKVLPELVYIPNYMEIALNNIGAFFHPVPSILNSGLIESGHVFKYYTEGISAHIASLLQRMDDEKAKICAFLGVKHVSLMSWLEVAYNATGDDLYKRIHSVEAYKEINAPTSLSHRYIYDDLLNGLVPIYNTAKYFSIEVPLIESFLMFASNYMQQDYFSEGRTYPLEFESILRIPDEREE